LLTLMWKGIWILGETVMFPRRGDLYNFDQMFFAFVNYTWDKIVFDSLSLWQGWLYCYSRNCWLSPFDSSELLFCRFFHCPCLDCLCVI
jgi:hypothetical protein